MTLKFLLTLSVMVPILAHAQPARRVVAVCPVRLKDGDFDRKLEKEVLRWVNEALVKRRIARADPAIVANELETFPESRCPLEEPEQVAFARAVGATDLLQVNVNAPAIVAGVLVSLDKAEAKSELLRFLAGDTSRGPLPKVLRETIFKFIDQLPILPGEELISPLVEAPPEPDKLPPNPPVSSGPPPAPTPRPPVPGGAWALLGGGAASLAGGGASFLFAGMKEGDFKNLLSTRPWRDAGDVARLETLQRESGQLRALGTGLAAVGVVAGVAGAAWAIASQQPAKAQAVSLQLAPGFLQVSGQF